MKLMDLIAYVDALAVRGSLDRDVGGVTRDSRSVGPDDVFVALPGTRFDGHDFVSKLHAAAVVVERAVDVQDGVTVVRVADTRVALAELAAALHQHPAAAMRVIGVTGTNGKTTVTTLIDEALRALNLKSGRIGTTGSFSDGKAVESALTTPMADDLQLLFANMRADGIGSVAIEVSSIGIEQHRVDAIGFHVAVFTNLGHDHLDYHGDLQTYASCKAQLFGRLLREPGGHPRAILCADDPMWSQMHAPDDRWLYGFSSGADLHIESVDTNTDGMRIAFSTPMGPAILETPLVGRYNAQNLVAAVGVLLTLDVPLADAVRGLSLVSGVDGRLEPVQNRHGLLVLVDYAHTPDALEAVLLALRDVSEGQLWCVFGCGGSRDAEKRPEMGRVVGRLADRAVVTSDNPRTEDPQQIIEQILLGMDGLQPHIEADREVAIAWAIGAAKSGDVVLIAGKGHEQTQEIQGVHHPFDDRDVARRALEALP